MTHITKYWIVAFIALATLCLFPVRSAAQLTTATLVGTITDQTGAVVSGATVSVVNVDTQFTSQTVSNGSGDYRIDLLPIGTYTMTVQSPGFKKYVQANIALSVNQVASVGAVLQPGGSQETLTVTSEPPQIDLENATVGRTIETSDLNNLPLVDRNAYSFLNLVPGVQSNTPGNTLGYPQQVVQINGSTLENNTGNVSYYLDGGLDMTGVRMTGNQMPNPEALAEFNVQTSNYNATYGRMSSGVVSAITKSGTNQFHGTVYEFHRETNFNSDSWNSNAVRNAVHRHFFGGVVGGPVIHDRTFFFFDYSGFRDQVSKLENNAILPTAKETAGDFSDYLPTPPVTTCGQTLSAADTKAGDFIVCNPTTRKPYAGNKITDPLDTTALNIIKTLPTANAGTPTAPVWIGYIPTPSHYNEYMGKIDQNFSPKNHLNGSWYYLKGQNTVTTSGANIPWSLQTQNYFLHVINLSDTITLSSNMIDQSWVTYTRSFGGRVNTPEKWLSDFGSAFAGQGKASLPDINVTAYFHGSDAIDGPTAGTNFYSLRHLFIWNKGNHTVEIGGEASLNKDILLTDLNNYGVWTFQLSPSARTGNALADFVLGQASKMTQDAPVEAVDDSFFFSAFIQDDWRVLRNLTINAGLRWDVQTAPTDPQNKESTFVAGHALSAINPAAPVGQLFPGDSGITRGIVGNPYKHYSPRLGFAWDVFGNGKTSVRGAAGIFWGGVSGNEWNATSNFYPFTLRYTFPVPGTLSNPYINSPSPFPFSYTPGKVAAAPSGTSLSGIGLAFRWPFTYQVNASVEQQITNSMVLGVTYVGSLSRALPFEPDLNYPVFNAANPASNTTNNANNRRPIPALGTLVELGDGPGGSLGRANSNYNAMQATISQRMSKGLSFHGYYIWSKTLSSVGLDSSNVTVEDGADLALEKGPTNPDLRGAFVMSLVWQPNYFKSNKIVHNIVEGWTVSPIVTLKTGAPFTVTSGIDDNNDTVSGDRANQTGNPYDSTINHQSRAVSRKQWFDRAAFCGYNVLLPTQCLGTGPAGSDGTSERNGYRGPAYRDVDMALLRDFHIQDSLIFQLRGESTNLLNMVNLNNPSNAAINNVTDQITTAAGMRQIQIGGRLTF